MNKGLVESIKSNFEAKETEELKEIWENHDLNQYSREAIEAARELLEERNHEPLKLSADTSAESTSMTFGFIEGETTLFISKIALYLPGRREATFILTNHRIIIGKQFSVSRFRLIIGFAVCALGFVIFGSQYTADLIFPTFLIGLIVGWGIGSVIQKPRKYDAVPPHKILESNSQYTFIYLKDINGVSVRKNRLSIIYKNRLWITYKSGEKKDRELFLIRKSDIEMITKTLGEELRKFKISQDSNN